MRLIHASAVRKGKASLVAGEVERIAWIERHSAALEALQHYGVAVGYDKKDCEAHRLTYLCFGPTDQVSYAQTIPFITRAIVLPLEEQPIGDEQDAVAHHDRRFPFPTAYDQPVPTAYGQPAVLVRTLGSTRVGLVMQLAPVHCYYFGRGHQDR